MSCWRCSPRERQRRHRKRISFLRGISNAIYQSDVRSFAAAPGFSIVRYKPDIRDVQVAGDWAFEWGVFDVGLRPSSGKPVEEVHGKLLRVLHRQSDGEWKFARVMALFDAN